MKKKDAKALEKPGRPGSEAMLIKPAEGISYASILRDLERRVNPDELGVTVQGIREKRSKDLLVELKCPKEGRWRLDSAFQEAIGISGTVLHLVTRIEVETTDLDPSIKGEEVEEAVREFSQQGPEMELRVALRKKPHRGIRNSYVILEEVRALKPLKAAHIKIGWVSCSVRRKVKTNRCYSCLCFRHSGGLSGTGQKQELLGMCRGRAHRGDLHKESALFRGHCLARKQGGFEFSVSQTACVNAFSFLL